MSLTDAPQQEHIAFQEHDLKGYKLEQQDAKWLLFVLIFGALALTIVVVQGWEVGRENNRLFVPLYFMPDTANIAVDILTSLAVITALMERAAEVFIGNMRAIKRRLSTRHLEALDKKLEERSVEIATLSKGGDADALQRATETQNALKDRRVHVEHRLTSYRTGTQIRAISFSLLFGTLIALAGVRVISPLLDVPYAALSNIQWAALQIVDIAGTAGLIAGGTSGIHRLIKNIGTRTEPETISQLEAATRPG